MAEFLLRARLEDNGCTGIQVDSSGTWATEGLAATNSAVDTLAAVGLDLGPHRARVLEADFLEAADLVVVMTSVHEREVLEVAPEVKSKMVLLKELAAMKDALDRDGRAADPSGRLRQLLAVPRPERRRALDVDDPMGLPIMAYKRCAGELTLGISALVEALCD